jgi:hypothetical protein
LFKNLLFPTTTEPAAVTCKPPPLPAAWPPLMATPPRPTRLAGRYHQNTSWTGHRGRNVVPELRRDIEGPLAEIGRPPALDDQVLVLRRRICEVLARVRGKRIRAPGQPDQVVLAVRPGDLQGGLQFGRCRRGLDDFGDGHEPLGRVRPA